MRYLIINGKPEKVPPFPHHKDYIYRCRQFFTAGGVLGHLTTGRFATLKELYYGRKNKTAVPRDLLIDITSSCNLSCKGCWASDYDEADNISFTTLDDLMTQMEKLGMMDCIMSGGEPLLRKDDILRLAEKHRKLTFGLFTNGTLVDDDLAAELFRLGNVNLFVSIEGYQQENDYRRGDGVYRQVIAAMDKLKQHHIGFAFSICYHAKNYLTITSDEYLDFLREKGAWFGWLFNYVPVGSDADLSLVLNPEQRAYARQRIEAYSKKNDFLMIDFWNNGHLVFGCVGAGNGFVHITAKGDVEPCAFCHYSDANIYNMSLAEALGSPFFKAFRKAQPFSDNPLRSCPLIDEPDQLVRIVNEVGAKSTHFSCPESPEALRDKTLPGAKAWEPVADKIFEDFPQKAKENWPKFLGFLKVKQKLTDGRR